MLVILVGHGQQVDISLPLCTAGAINCDKLICLFCFWVWTVYLRTGSGIEPRTECFSLLDSHASEVINFTYQWCQVFETMGNWSFESRIEIDNTILQGLPHSNNNDHRSNIGYITQVQC